MNKKLKIGVVSVSLAAVLFIIVGGLGVHASNKNDEGAYRQLGVYSEVLQRIRSEYVEEPNFDAVRDGALHGLLESLDASSSYLSPAEYKRYKEHKADLKANTGATLSKRFGFAAIVAVVPGSPAEKAGLNTGDIIEAVEGRSTRDISLAELKNIFAGQKGSNISFTVLRPKKAEPDNITVTRDEIVLPATQEKVLESNIAYIKPGSLVKGKAQEIAAKLKQAQSSGAKKLILDLRDDAEGDFSEAIAAANLFLDHGIITTLKGQTYNKEEFVADPQKAITKLPMVVLVNRGTAGASEVLAAAILDDQRGDVIGDKTFGIGSVQKTIEVPDGSALILSVAKYYSPSGKAIQDSSVTPNILVADVEDQEVVTDEDGNEATPETKPAPVQHNDEQLQRAIAVLKNKTS